MRLTRRGEYALRAMLELSSMPDGSLARSPEIAQRQEIPPKFLPQIVNELGRASLIETVRGAAGGVRLARPAAEITVAQVIEAVEGPVTLNECLITPQPCTRREGCALAPVWEDAQKALMDVLEGTTLDTLAGVGSDTGGGGR